MGAGKSESTASGLRARLRDVYWIGGAPGGGKSTIARRLAHRYGFHLYVTDDTMADHARRSTAIEAPYLARFRAMDMNERWVNRSPDTMLDTFHWFRGEGFSLIVEDLLRLPAGTRVIAEGFRLLPHLVMPLVNKPNQAVWLLPTPEFRRAALASRGPVWDIPSKTTNPERARVNLAERDKRFTQRLADDAERLGCPTLKLADGTSEDDTLNQVAQIFGLPGVAA